MNSRIENKLTIEKLTGVTEDILSKSYRHSYGSVFFKPYDSAEDFLYRATSIVTAPIILGSLSAFLALSAVCEAMKMIANLATLKFSDARLKGIESLGTFFIAAVTLLAAVASPMINCVDLIVSVVSSIMDSPAELAHEESAACYTP